MTRSMWTQKHMQLGVGKLLHHMLMSGMWSCDSGRGVALRCCSSWGWFQIHGVWTWICVQEHCYVESIESFHFRLKICKLRSLLFILSLYALHLKSMNNLTAKVLFKDRSFSVKEDLWKNENYLEVGAIHMCLCTNMQSLTFERL